MVSALCLYSPVRADNLMQLQPETASADSSTPAAITPAPQAAPPAQPNETLLYGSAQKKLKKDDGSTDLQGETPTSDQEKLFNLAIQKLDRHEELTAEEYRSLSVGTTGMEVHQQYGELVGKVIAVYKDSPADKAGIEVGDTILNKRDKAAEKIWKQDPTKPLYEVQFNPVGFEKQVTVMRDDGPVTLTLVDMNIEDIKESRYRKVWEKLVREGYPTKGVFIGPKLDNMAQIH
jgi:C-terminal processing protease CtpA/Prc